ncbi:redoxin domain-containing protein [Marinicauda pacifica]|uniref:redoxin domain-containing protein n=1 Tax=Marinicauda pacifica TaxID=1133559 RepID=UPI0035C84611
MTPDLRPVQERSAPILKDYVQAIGPGDPAPDVTLMDQDGRSLRLFEDAFAGRPLVLVFCGFLDDPASRAVLERYSATQGMLAAAGATLIVVTADTDARRARQLRAETGLAAPVCGDANGAAFAQYGLVKGLDIPGRLVERTVVITANCQVRSIMDDAGSADAAAAQARALAEEAASARDWIPGHAPVLILPNALDPEDCRLLIEHCEAGGEFAIAKTAAPGPQGLKIPVSDYNRQDRIDHVIHDPAILQRVDQKLHQRVLPMIRKAFAFDVTQRESLHVARYSGRRDGIEIGHRDNVAASSAYRRFALSISLNDGYDGGELVFREYAEKGYRGAPGTALVFSSSLLHEIEETTRGVRYNLISHFYNEQSMREARGG